MIIDAHAHYLPDAYIRAAKGVIPEIRREGARLFLGDVSLGQIAERITSVPAVLEGMAHRGISARVITPPPFTLRYDVDLRVAERLTRILNEEMASAAMHNSPRIAALGTAPLQHPTLAVRELERGVMDLGLRGVIIGTQVRGEALDDEALLPVFRTAAELGAVLFLHPDYVPHRGLSRHYLVNLVGNPFETTGAIASLIFGGVLSRFPHLKVLCAHAGGATAFLLGRLHHGWTVRPESRAHLDRPPGEILRTLYFDSITHSPASLEFLIKTVGGDHVLYGTDDPFDMADPAPLGDQVVAGRSLSAWAHQWSQTARELFRLSAGVAPGTSGRREEMGRPEPDPEEKA